MHFFGKDLRFAPQFYRRDTPAYLAEFDAANGHKRAGEASVWYLFSEHAAAEMKSFNPDSQVVIMLRNPVEMIHSLYYQFRFDGNEQLASFEDAVMAEGDRRAGERLGRQHYFAQGLEYRKTALFSRQVERYFRVFGRDRVHVIIYDDFAANADAVFRQTLEFLGLTPAPIKCGAQVINGNKHVKNPVLRAALNDPAVRRAVLAARPWLPQFAFTALGKVEARLRKMNSVSATRQALAPDLRRQLDQEFAPEVERLSALLGRDLTGWSQGGRWQQEIETPAAVHEAARPLEACDEHVVSVA